jgi:uncharacterized membrane protein YphA (DoxX/SURF4 family)
MKARITSRLAITPAVIECFRRAIRIIALVALLPGQYVQSPIGGLAVLVGGFVTLASIPMAMLLFVAIFTVHLPNGFSSVKLVSVTAAGPQFGPVGYEVGLLYLACLAALVFIGAGPFSLDSFLQKRER